MVEAGDEIELEVGAVAHGGHCLARIGEGGRVVFVRHTLPGERVRVRLTEAAPEARFWLAGDFEVRRNGQALATCSGGTGFCEVSVP